MTRYSGVLLLVLVGFLIAWILQVEPPEDFEVNQQNTVVVSVHAQQATGKSVPITARGYVDTRWRSNVSAEVSGKVVDVSPQLLVGSTFNQGDILVTVDDTRYQVELLEAQSDVASAQQHLQEEQQAAKRAQLNWQASGLAGQPSDILLRKAQIHAATLQVNAAKAKVAYSKSMLSKTQIVAPYDGTTISRQINVGDIVHAETALASIYAHTQLQVRLPLAQSTRLDADNKKITLISEQDNSRWSATITRRDNVVDPSKHWVYAIAELEQGNTEHRSPFLGEYVKAILYSEVMEHVLTLPQACINGDTRIWQVDSNNTLQLLPNTYLNKDEEFVYVQVEAAFAQAPIRIVCYPNKDFLVGTSVLIDDYSVKNSTP